MTAWKLEDPGLHPKPQSRSASASGCACSTPQPISTLRYGEAAVAVWVGEQAHHAEPGAPSCSLWGWNSLIPGISPSVVSIRLDMARVGEMVQEVVAVQGTAIYFPVRLCTHGAGIVRSARCGTRSSRSPRPPNSALLRAGEGASVWWFRWQGRDSTGERLLWCSIPRQPGRSDLAASASLIPAGDGYFPAEAQRFSGQPCVPASARQLPWKHSWTAFDSATGQPVLPTVCLSLILRSRSWWPRWFPLVVFSVFQSLFSGSRIILTLKNFKGLKNSLGFTGIPLLKTGMQILFSWLYCPWAQWYTESSSDFIAWSWWKRREYKQSAAC